MLNRSPLIDRNSSLFIIVLHASTLLMGNQEVEIFQNLADTYGVCQA